MVWPFSPSVKLTEAASAYRSVTSSGFGSGSLTRCPGLASVIGWVEYRSVGAGWATVPGAHHDTVTDVAGSAPQVSSSCSGSVVVGSGSVVVGGPLGAVAAAAERSAQAWPAVLAVVAALAACGRSTLWPVRASPAAAPRPATPPRKMRRETRG